MSRVSPRWEDPRTVSGFVASPPNPILLEWARARRTQPNARCLDLGCGAGRNALPLAELGYHVVGADLAMPMLTAAAARKSPDAAAFAQSPMTPLPFADRAFDLVVAHGIWNLARSGQEFRAAVAEAARVAKPGAGLFLFTFARYTLPADAVPDPGESFVFSSWNGEPQCFLTESQILEELAAGGFARDSSGPLTVYNLPDRAGLAMERRPVIYEGTFRRA